MNARTTTLSALAVAALALTACSPSGDMAAEDMPSVQPVESGTTEAAPSSAQPAPTAVEASPEPTADDADKSPRGNLIAEIGQTGEISSMDGKLEASFTVKDISPGVCTEPYASGVENGQIVFVTMDIVTTPELAQSAFPEYSASGYDWKFIAPSGTTFNGDLATISTYGCLPESSILPNSIGPAESVTGIVVLDVPEAAGTLVYSPNYGTGFEYNF